MSHFPGEMVCKVDTQTNRVNVINTPLIVEVFELKFSFYKELTSVTIHPYSFLYLDLLTFPRLLITIPQHSIMFYPLCSHAYSYCTSNAIASPHFSYLLEPSMPSYFS